MKSVLIYSGSNYRAIIAFCRFATSRNIDFYIVANGKDDLILKTEYSSRLIYTRTKNKLDINELLNIKQLIQYRFKVSDLLVLPSTEYLNRFLTQNQSILELNNISSGLCDKQLYSSISNKYSFGNLAKRYGIKTPNELPERPNTFPYVVKPRKYFSTSNTVNIKPVIVNAPEDLDLIPKSLKKENIYYQEFISGESEYLLFNISAKEKEYSVFSQKNLLQQHNGGSMILCKSSNIHNNSKLVSPYLELFFNEDFKGLVMVEVRIKDNEFYMIEANPRLWGPSQLILDSNMNLFDCFAMDNDLLHDIPELQYKNDTWYFWSGGLIENQKQNLLPVFMNFTHEEFFTNYRNILMSEVYFRPDTLNLYQFENQQ